MVLLERMKLNPKVQYEIRSAFHTFITAAALEGVVQLQNHDLTLSKGVLLALCASAFRAGLKGLLTFLADRLKK